MEPACPVGRFPCDWMDTPNTHTYTEFVSLTEKLEFPSLIFLVLELVLPSRETQNTMTLNAGPHGGRCAVFPSFPFDSFPSTVLPNLLYWNFLPRLHRLGDTIMKFIVVQANLMFLCRVFVKVGPWQTFGEWQSPFSGTVKKSPLWGALSFP